MRRTSRTDIYDLGGLLDMQEGDTIILYPFQTTYSVNHVTALGPMYWDTKKGGNIILVSYRCVLTAELFNRIPMSPRMVYEVKRNKPKNVQTYIDDNYDRSI